MPKNNQSIGNITANRDAIVNQTINEGKSVAEQMEITFMALKQMPRRLQEAADSGAKSFSFDEARNELEKFYAVMESQNNTELQRQLEKFQLHYNDYIALLNDAIGGKATLDDVNKFHTDKIITWFDNNIRRPIKNLTNRST